MAKCVIDYWGTRLDAKIFYGMSGTILSFNVVHVNSVVIIVLLKSKQTSLEGKIRNFKLY